MIRCWILISAWGTNKERLAFGDAGRSIFNQPKPI